jgi:hypothetical protein
VIASGIVWVATSYPAARKRATRVASTASGGAGSRRRPRCRKCGRRGSRAAEPRAPPPPPRGRSRCPRARRRRAPRRRGRRRRGAPARGPRVPGQSREARTATEPLESGSEKSSRTRRECRRNTQTGANWGWWLGTELNRRHADFQGDPSLVTNDGQLGLSLPNQDVSDYPVCPRKPIGRVWPLLVRGKSGASEASRAGKADSKPGPAAT